MMIELKTSGKTIVNKTKATMVVEVNEMIRLKSGVMITSIKTNRAKEVVVNEVA